MEDAPLHSETPAELPRHQREGVHEVAPGVYYDENNDNVFLHNFQPVTEHDLDDTFNIPQGEELVHVPLDILKTAAAGVRQIKERRSAEGQQ